MTSLEQEGIVLAEGQKMASLGGTQDRRKELKMMLGREAGGGGEPHLDFVYYPALPGMSLSFSFSIKEDLGFPHGSEVKNLPARQEPQETWVQSLGQEDPLEESMAAHSSLPAWRILRTEEPGGFLVLRVTKSWTQLQQLSTHTLTYKEDLGVTHKREGEIEGGLDTWTRCSSI